MREQRFIAERTARWQQLETTLAQLDRRGPAALDATSADAFAFAYRAVTSDLALALARGYAPELTAYLNRLATRAHAFVYVGTSPGGWSRVRAFVGRTFPREVRRSWRPIGICVALTVLAAIVAATAVGADPANAFALLPEQMIPHRAGSLHDTNFGFDRSYAPAMSSAIIANNVRVAIMAFAGGMTAGLLTLWLITENGLMLGGLSALYARGGTGADFWATIAPHGVLELSAIQVAGGAGLLIAAGIVAPGRLRRSAALVRNARRAAVLGMGASLMLVAAGLIEGFLSPQRFPIAVRLAIGGVTAIALVAYLTASGRSGSDAAFAARDQPGAGP